MRKTVLASTASLLLLVPTAPASAMDDGCTLLTPNILRDITDCAQYVLDYCIPGTTDIVTEVKECLGGGR